MGNRRERQERCQDRVRAGYGLFYDRFGESFVTQYERLNGITQQQFIVAGTTDAPIDFFPTVPARDRSACFSDRATIYQINSSTAFAYVLQSAVSVERQLTKIAKRHAVVSELAWSTPISIAQR